jgi:hypothetical protein
MKSFVIAATAAVVLSGSGSGSGAQAAYYKHRHNGGLSAWERVAIARDRARVNAIKRHAWADGRITLWERARIRAAEARHSALVYRYRHN